MASQWPPKKNTAFTLYFTLYKNDGTVIANPGTCTKKVSKDGGAIADISGSVTEVDTTYGLCSIGLSSSEMNADAVWVQIKDDTAGCVPFTTVLYTTGSLHDEVKSDTAAILADTGTDGVVIADGGITAAKIASNTITASALGANTLTAAKVAADVWSTIADAVWDETANEHLTVGTFGQRFAVAHQGTAQAGAGSTITLAAGASATDDLYNEALIVVTGGTGAGQSNIISGYNGTTKVATVSNAWRTNPSSDSTYVIIPSSTSPAPVAGVVDANITKIGGADVNAASAQLGVNVVNWKGAAAPAMTGDAYARLGAPAGASVSADIAAIEAQTDDIGTEIAAIKAKTDALPASPAAVGSAMTLANDAVSADALSAAAVDKILDEVVEGQGNITLRQSLMAILAFAAGQASGGGTTECVFESPNGVATRITMTVNSAGDRSAVTLNFE